MSLFAYYKALSPKKINIHFINDTSEDKV